MNILNIFGGRSSPSYDIKTVNDLSAEARLGIDRALFLSILNTNSSYLCQEGKVVGAWTDSTEVSHPKCTPMPYAGGTAWIRVGG